MEETLIVKSADLASALSANRSARDAPAVDLTSDHRAAIEAVWAITNTAVADQYEVSIASSDEGGWTVVRVAAFHKGE